MVFMTRLLHRSLQVATGMGSCCEFELCRQFEKASIQFRVYWALEYHTLILFLGPVAERKPLWKKSLYFFLPGYFKAQFRLWDSLLEEST